MQQYGQIYSCVVLDAFRFWVLLLHLIECFSLFARVLNIEPQCIQTRSGSFLAYVAFLVASSNWEVTGMTLSPAFWFVPLVEWSWLMMLLQRNLLPCFRKTWVVLGSAPSRLAVVAGSRLGHYISVSQSYPYDRVRMQGCAQRHPYYGTGSGVWVFLGSCESCHITGE